MKGPSLTSLCLSCHACWGWARAWFQSAGPPQDSCRIPSGGGVGPRQVRRGRPGLESLLGLQLIGERSPRYCGGGDDSSAHWLCPRFSVPSSPICPGAPRAALMLACTPESPASYHPQGQQGSLLAHLKVSATRCQGWTRRPAVPSWTGLSGPEAAPPHQKSLGPVGWVRLVYQIVWKPVLLRRLKV